MSLPALRTFEQRIERQLRLLELKKTIIERNIGRQIRLFERKRGIRLDDEVRFLRSWIERPLTIGAVTPSGKMLARAIARYVDPHCDGPVVELGPGTGPVTEALVQAGVAPSRLVLVEFNPTFCRILRARYPEATLVQGDAYSLRRLLETLLLQPAAAVVSGLPLVTKPIRMRLRLIRDAFDLMLPGAPFVQFSFGRLALAATAGGFSVEALRAHLDEYSARARLGLSEDLTFPIMFTPKILVLAGSLRAGSYNARLAALVAKELVLAEADVSRISLADYPMPLLDADYLADAGPPDNAFKLKEMFTAHQGVFIASPEYSASVTPLLKNAIDWMTRVRERNELNYAAFRGRAFALGSAVNGAAGGLRGLMALRQVLELGCGALRDPGTNQCRARRSGVR